MVKFPTIRKQLATFKKTPVKTYLFETGGWEKHELKDHEKNLTRILWLACCDIKEDIAYRKRYGRNG
jgi:hypothetical protein